MNKFCNILTSLPGTRVFQRLHRKRPLQLGFCLVVVFNWYTVEKDRAMFWKSIPKALGIQGDHMEYRHSTEAGEYTEYTTILSSRCRLLLHCYLENMVARGFISSYRLIQ